MEKRVRLELRIPLELKRKLKIKAASQDFVSVNQFMIFILDAYDKNHKLFEIKKGNHDES
jgi:predicted HicB family RNase H-like nuclease